MKGWKVLFFFMACLSLLRAEEETTEQKEIPETVSRSLFHLDIGSGPYPLPVPVFSIGYRKQSGHQGMDLSLYASTVVYLTQVKLSASYLFYVNPSLKGQIYIGPGVGGSVVFQSGKKYDRALVALSPELLVGKEYIGRTGSRRLVQMQISIPTYTFGRIRSLKKTDRVIYYPLIIVSYGICF